MLAVVTVADTLDTSKREGRCLVNNIHPNYPNIIKLTLVKPRTRDRVPSAVLEQVQPILEFLVRESPFGVPLEPPVTAASRSRACMPQPVGELL